MYKSVREMFMAVYKAKYANSEAKLKDIFVFADGKFINPTVQVEWVAFQKVLHADYMSVKEVWEAAGGNPGIKACREEVLSVLRTLDEVCDEASPNKTTFEVLYHEKGNLFRASVDVCEKTLFETEAEDLTQASRAWYSKYPQRTIYSIDYVNPQDKVYGYAVGA